mmetsp:Transcript_3263/g.4706  ORF Transcript_3263/g.4706 Transcript_3263/m.4706 type:complete len:375 (+) Transcript_3263:17-1141(+)
MSFASFLSNPGDFDSFLSEAGTDKLLVKMLEKMAAERPADHNSFMIAFLDANRKERSDKDDSKDDMEIAEDNDTPPELYHHHRGRRGAVSSEPNGEVETNAKISISNPKDAQTNQRLNDALSSHILCSHLDAGERKEVFDRMSEASFSKGDFVIKQGSDGDCFYVVNEGELEVYVNTPEERKLVQHLKSGGSFGELALIYNTPRAADVVAITDVKLWLIDRVTYRKVLMDSTIRKRALYEEFLDRVPILAPLQKYERLVVADALEPVEFVKDEVIVSQGDCGDVFYIIIAGEAEVTQVDRDNNKKHLVDLKVSDYFGEIALLTDRPRAATVVAKSDTLKCVRLDRARFNRVLGPCEDILRRNMEAYHKYMANHI